MRWRRVLGRAWLLTLEAVGAGAGADGGLLGADLAHLGLPLLHLLLLEGGLVLLPLEGDLVLLPLEGGLVLLPLGGLVLLLEHLLHHHLCVLQVPLVFVPHLPQHGEHALVLWRLRMRGRHCRRPRLRHPGRTRRRRRGRRRRRCC